MKTILKLYGKSNWKIAVYSLLFIMTTSVVGHASSYGRIQSSGEITRMFETYQVLPDHKYYYSGSAARPRGIIGIHNDYTLGSRLWKPVDLTSDQLKDWIRSILSETTVSLKHNGASILDPNGKRVRVWDSPWATTRVKVESDKRIMVPTPNERKYRRRGALGL